MGKNIVVLSDGTGQKGGIGTNTNVYKLFNMMEDRTNKQIAYYDPGLGTDWRKVTGAIGGMGFSKNIKQCYQFIFENFEADDKVFMFGFSRGAATVRSLSAFIHLFGILPKSRADLIGEAFKIYQIDNSEKRARKAKAFIGKHHTMWANVEFLGVWDTVAALGLPLESLSMFLDKIIPHKFHNLDLSASVKFARHALSIDDERKTFHPELWNKIEKMEPADKMKQVWFTGVHTDVGGGYDDQNLSDISLRWMIQEAQAKGLIIYEKSKAFNRLLLAKPDINGDMGNEQEGRPGKWYRREVRSWNEGFHGKATIHKSVLDRKRNVFNEASPPYDPWILKLDYNVED